MTNTTLLNELLDDLILEAVRLGVPKAHLAQIYDVKLKTIPAVKKERGKKNV